MNISRQICVCTVPNQTKMSVYYDHSPSVAAHFVSLSLACVLVLNESEGTTTRGSEPGVV